MTIRRLAAAAGMAALTIMGLASLVHTGTGDAQASARRPAMPSYVAPTVPAMHLGVTYGETTTSVPVPH